MGEAIIDALSAITGWTAETGITLETQGFSDYISGFGSASLALRVSAGSDGKSASKTLTFDATGFQWISFSAISLRKPSYSVNHIIDAMYAVELAAGQVFYVPIKSQFSRVFIPVDGFTALTRFKVTVLHDNADFLIVSNLMAVTDAFPADILNAIKTGIEVQRDRLAPGREIGTVTAAKGSRSIGVDDDWSWVEKNVVVRIGTGNTAEEHLISNASGNRIAFADTLDGPSLLFDHSRSQAYITFPVDVGYYDREEKLPGVAIWYSSPTPAPRNSRAEESPICWGPLGAYVRRDGAIMKWRVSLEIAARSPELVSDATTAVRAFLASSEIWAHGQRLWFEWTDPAVDSEPVEGYDIVPRASYVFDVEVKEDSWQLQRMTSGNPTLTVRPIA